MDAMERCIEGMGSMMGGMGPMMGGGMMSLALLAVALLLFVWVLGLAALGTLGVWGRKKALRQVSRRGRRGHSAPKIPSDLRSRPRGLQLFAKANNIIST